MTLQGLDLEEKLKRIADPTFKDSLSEQLAQFQAKTQIKRLPPPEESLGEYFVFAGRHVTQKFMHDESRLVRNQLGLINSLGMTLVQGPLVYPMQFGEDDIGCTVQSVIEESHILEYINWTKRLVQLQICCCGEGVKKVNILLANRYLQESYKAQRISLLRERRWIMRALPIQDEEVVSEVAMSDEAPAQPARVFNFPQLPPFHESINFQPSLRVGAG